MRANVRVAGAARRSAREALVVALRAGGFSGLIVVALMVLGIATLYSLLHIFFVRFGTLSDEDLPLLLVGYGFGASFVALFAQLGGGIYTKAADVGADLVGKVEAGIPEDDPRNPAVIADLVGDNVGDCAARGADLFESISAEVISAMILGSTMAKQANLPSSSGFILFPLVVHSMDLLVSAAGIMSVAAKPPPGASPTEDPYDVIKGGYIVSIGCSVAGFLVACRVMLTAAHAPWAWVHFAGCGMIGRLRFRKEFKILSAAVKIVFLVWFMIQFISVQFHSFIHSFQFIHSTHFIQFNTFIHSTSIQFNHFFIQFNTFIPFQFIHSNSTHLFHSNSTH